MYIAFQSLLMVLRELQTDLMLLIFSNSYVTDLRERIFVVLCRPYLNANDATAACVNENERNTICQTQHHLFLNI